MAFMCRYGNQNVFQILGINRCLTVHETVLFQLALRHHMDKEFTPIPGSTPTQ